jgi:hypothetical protein
MIDVSHHRALYGIHAIPVPLWGTFRYRKFGPKPAAEHLTKDDK